MYPCVKLLRYFVHRLRIHTSLEIQDNKRGHPPSSLREAEASARNPDWSGVPYVETKKKRGRGGRLAQEGNPSPLSPSPRPNASLRGSAKTHVRRTNELTNRRTTNLRTAVVEGRKLSFFPDYCVTTSSDTCCCIFIVFWFFIP